MRILFLIVLTLSQIISAQHIINEKFKNKIQNLLRGDIEQIDSKKLFSDRDKYLLLDAREKVEFETSHISGAQYLGYKDFDVDKSTTSLSKDKTLVIYCSVGYRSEIVARELKRKGYNVLNLFGGIFEWNNSGYPLVDNKQKPTNKIHTYNQNWGKWVEKGEKIH